MKKYLNFINESLTSNQHKYVTMIIDYLTKKSNFKLFEYDEDFDVIKSGSNTVLSGKLFFLLPNKAIRFNFDKERLVSIDLWNKFEFNVQTITNKPSYTLTLVGSIVNELPNILDFLNGDFEVNESSEDPKVKTAEEEKVELKSMQNKTMMDQDIDVFETIKLYTAQVAYKVSNSLVISGGAGLGKTFDVEDTLNTIRAEYVAFAGDISVAGLYETLFINRHKLIVFDDIDEVFEDKKAVKLLMAVLDTKPKRTVSRLIKTNFDSEGMSDTQMETKYRETGKLPNKFVFDGRIIFITNVPGKDMNKALISRSLYLDVNPDLSQVVKRVEQVMPSIQPNIPIEKKKDLLDVMVMLAEKYELRFPLNLRTFIHCLNIRVANDFDMVVGGEKIKAYLMLIKQYLVKK